ncbi:winged helix-turn-helix domain-containing protein [Porphyromonadaceae bacterium W3.11]|nr:winged helix-turn-helix domain-containing protein [Porphyromonadaceae bacterium W3.11]
MEDSKMIDVIGTNAGIIWQTLSESEEGMTVKEIQKESGIRTQNEIYMALGWLAREGKVEFSGEGKDLKVILVIL